PAPRLEAAMPMRTPAPPERPARRPAAVAGSAPAAEPEAPMPTPAPSTRRPAAVAGSAPAAAPVLPAMPPLPSLRPLPAAAAPPSRPAPAGALFQWPVSPTPIVGADDAESSHPVADPSLARLARGVQDCARALAGLADRLDGLERRLDAVAPGLPPAHPLGVAAVPNHRAPGYESDPLALRVRALEALSADRLHVLDQRLGRLETLPAAVGRIEQDLILLAEVGRAG